MKGLIEKSQLNELQQEKIKEVFNKLMNKEPDHCSDGTDECCDASIISSFLWLFGDDIENW